MIEFHHRVAQQQLSQKDFHIANRAISFQDKVCSAVSSANWPFLSSPPSQSIVKEDHHTGTPVLPPQTSRRQPGNSAVCSFLLAQDLLAQYLPIIAAFVVVKPRLVKPFRCSRAALALIMLRASSSTNCRKAPKDSHMRIIPVLTKPPKLIHRSILPRSCSHPTKPQRPQCLHSKTVHFHRSSRQARAQLSQAFTADNWPCTALVVHRRASAVDSAHKTARFPTTTRKSPSAQTSKLNMSRKPQETPEQTIQTTERDSISWTHIERWSWILSTRVLFPPTSSTKK